MSGLDVYFTLGMGYRRNSEGDGLLRSLTGVTSVHTRLRSLHMLRALERERVPPQVMEFGFGEGYLLLAMARRHPQSSFLGMEIDSGHVRNLRARAKAAGLANVEAVQGDFQDMVPSPRFGLIYCADVLEHIPRDRALMEFFAASMLPGGRLVLHVPLRRSLQRRFLPWFKSHTDPGHVREEYTPEELTSLVAGAGLQPRAPEPTFSPPGEAAFELNSLCWKSRTLDRLVRPLTLFPAMLLGLADLLPRSRGNSILLEARKAAA
ncbi:class I SAM-dependent methyltransferase [Fundidesulfovibrio soli]|uniref:class I SAM-dependent methyltransferase n=1 Tax=Fundidesulfovibrio soli TaxID=2922716 RepID=UPI001FAE8290|nr:class I SAM-dependent methyltransferase [Fundidesulfovibrio soli]